MGTRTNLSVSAGVPHWLGLSAYALAVVSCSLGLVTPWSAAALVALVRLAFRER